LDPYIEVATVRLIPDYAGRPRQAFHKPHQVQYDLILQDATVVFNPTKE
jgi:hypothetical protein